jgi:glycosyltransferase involved in cell wall biosynthesis
MKRLLILYSNLSGYTAACQRALRERRGVELMVFHWPETPEAPFDENIYAHIDHRHDKGRYTRSEILARARDFAPDAVLMVGWMDADYLAVARALRREGVPVIAGSDTQWRGDIRQRLARRLAPWYLHPAIDVLWVCGERQRRLAAALGYSGSRCWTGVYACDWERFAIERPRARDEAPPAFLYVGRYLARKGLDTLIEAYRRYRASVEMPWELLLAGAGPLAHLLVGQPGLRDLGFIQPTDLPALMRGGARAFVLPSRVEPWGVVAQEAAAAGLPLICSDACGAAVHLLQDHYNGFVFAAGDAVHLAACLRRVSLLDAERWAAMSQAGHHLSRQFTPERWTRTLVEGIEEWRSVEGRGAWER